MFVEKNTLSAIKAYYIHELSSLYDKNEVDQMLFIVANHIFGWDKLTYRINQENRLSESELLKFHWVLKRLRTAEPLQHIIGETIFYDLTFKVSPDVLIPRQETEELVHLILQNIKEGDVLLDIGTGSGIIPVSIKANFPNCKVFGVDISEEALKVAEENASINAVDVQFQQLDILNTNSLKDFSPTIIVSNPPYITNKEKEAMHQNVLDFEPHLALFVQDYEPLVFYQKIAELAIAALPINGQLFFEINEHYGNETEKLLKSIGFSDIRLIKDLNNRDRIVHAVR